MGQRRLQGLGRVVRQILPSIPCLESARSRDSINSNGTALPVAGIELIPGAPEFTAQEWI